MEIVDPVGETTTRRGPGRPHKIPAPATPDFSATWAKLTPAANVSAFFTQSNTRTVIRVAQSETSKASEDAMES
ncbi:BgtAc-31459 [Blumeria graminis f. sp. tritici]|uniref:BgtAc-31459 n=2 Tax=Blumeria graminis f. sp. tritici TaxID=62690 RepID=A0A9X9MMQ1_BLUGR|nr:hypothetical protein BGT96224_Ac31459 [Blumeria graminis f. sp. tritici 96224]VDB93286.1 BgtAc-31459 [Blumeria graminis f. sp. tritici]